MSGNHGFFCTCKGCTKKYSQIGSTLPDSGRRRERPTGRASYGRGSRSESYGSSSYSMKPGTFDGMPSLSRRRDDGKIDIFYGPEPLVDLDSPKHGHAVILNGKLIYKRRPGESKPVVDTGE